MFYGDIIGNQSDLVFWVAPIVLGAGNFEVALTFTTNLFINFFQQSAGLHYLSHIRLDGADKIVLPQILRFKLIDIENMEFDLSYSAKYT